MTTKTKWDVAIPIVFPDHEITVNTRALGVEDLATELGLPKEVAQFSTKLSFLGHAGVLFIKHTGLTKYFEYGRYQSAQGEVVKRSISDCKPGPDGHPTQESLTKVLKQISNVASHGTRIEAAYIVVEGSFDAMHSYATKQKSQNTNSKRTEYSLLSNSCLHFMKHTVEASGVVLPSVGTNFRPVAYMNEVQKLYPDLSYASGKMEIQAIGSEKKYVPSWAGSKGMFQAYWDEDYFGRRVKKPQTAK